MKILFNCLTTEKGGAERVICVLANEFAKKDDVVVLTLKKNTKDAYKFDRSVKRLCVDRTSYEHDGKTRSKLRKLSFARLSRLRKILVDENPDIIISFLPEPSLRLMFVSKYSPRVRRIPKIVSIRNDPEKEFSNPLIRFAMKGLYKAVDGMVYQTKDAKNYFRGIVETTNQVVIQNPIDEKFLIEPKDDKYRQKRIISVGRLEPQKNHELLIKSFGGIINNVDDDYTLDIYGEGSMRKSLQEMIDGMGLNEKVFLKGKTDDIVSKLNDSRIFVLSSNYEGMPNALMEAMALGLPCISTDCPCGGPKSLIKNGDNGLLVKNGDRVALGKAICRLANEEKIRKNISKKALLIRGTNNPSKIVGKWYDLIDKVLGERA